MPENRLNDARQKVYESDFLTITVQEDHNFFVADWSGILTAEVARKGCAAVLECLKQYPHSKVLNNNTKVTGHYPGAIDWVGKVWFPSMYRLGVRWFAWVYSPEFYTQIGTDQIIKLSSQVTIETFYGAGDAVHWLERLSEKVLE